MNATHEVVRAIPGPDGVRIEPGTRVNARDWRNLDRLTEQRFLRPVEFSAGTGPAEPTLAPAASSRRGGR